MIRKNLPLFILLILAAPTVAFAEDGSGSAGLISIGAGLAVGLAGIGGAIGQGLLVSSGLESIGRNPSASGQLQTPMILGLVFVEAIVILAFVIAFFLQGKV